MTHPARSLALVCPALALGAATTLLGPPALAGDEAPPVAALQVADGEGRVVSLPLEHTEVRGEVSGFVARVEVVQTYGNPYEEPIEATYVFPLPERAAVDDFEMEVGPRRVRGEIRRREEARRIYEQARSSGFTASLLEQERPNVFTQSVANILPGHTIRVRLRYVDLLPYEAGSFRFLFPMVVGPRYFPGARRAAGTQPPQDAATPAAPRRAAADAAPPGDGRRHRSRAVAGCPCRGCGPAPGTADRRRPRR
jgi:Ca-activated chloride channel family protein